MTDHTARPADEARRCRLLDAALSVFGRYGYRKTSMEEVSQAAEVSRQALYLHFSTKEELFRAMAAHALERNVGKARAVLADEQQSLETRLVGAFDEWMGHFVGLAGAGATDLTDAAGRLAGDIVARYEAEFVAALTATLEDSALMASYTAAGLTARQLAEGLEATARGHKDVSSTRAEFTQRIAVAARTLCAPLAVSRS